MKKTIVLPSTILLNTPFTINNKPHNNLSIPRESNKVKRLEFSDHQTNNNSENYAPYLFALKIELEKYKELRGVYMKDL